MGFVDQFSGCHWGFRSSVDRRTLASRRVVVRQINRGRLLRAAPADVALAGNGHPFGAANDVYIGPLSFFFYPLSATLWPDGERLGEPFVEPREHLVKVGLGQDRNFVRHMPEATRRHGRGLIADRPPLLAADRRGDFMRPRIVVLRYSRDGYDKARAMKGVLVGHHDHRPRLLHFRQPRVGPKIAPIDLPNLRGGRDARLDPRRPYRRPLLRHTRLRRPIVMSMRSERPSR